MIVADLLNSFFQLILDLVIFLVNLILTPIDALISSIFPNFSDSLTPIVDMLNYSLTYLGYLVDSLGLLPITITLLVEFLIFKLTLPLQIWIVKISIRWYNNLKT